MKNKFKFSSTLGSISLILMQACGGAYSPQASSGDSRVLWENHQFSLTGSLSTLGPFLTLTSTIVPPSGQFANDIFVRGANAYVSYNQPGAASGGAIDQLNLSSAFYPVRTASMTSASDINGVYVDALNNVYATGGDNASGANLLKLGISGLGFSQTPQTFSLPSFAGTAVRQWGLNLYALSGNTGGLSILPVLSLANQSAPVVSIPDARGMDQNGLSNLWVVTGGASPSTAAHLLELAANGTVLNTVDFPGANSVPESKSSVKVGLTAVAVSLGSQGASIVCALDHQVMASVPQGTVGGVATADSVTNSVAFGDGLFFVANGSAGVSVYSITNPLVTSLVGQLLGNTSLCGQVALTYQGQIDFGAGSISANNVYYANGILYIATGAGGFKVVKVDTTLLSAVTGLIANLL